MNHKASVGVCISIFLLLSGCVSMHTNTRAPEVSETAVPLLNINQPVAFRNGARKTGEIEIGSWTPFTVYADLSNYTESAIGTAKNVLGKQNIRIRDNANKVLEFSVYSAKSERDDIWTFGKGFIVTTRLRVKTGNGMSRDYVSSIRHGNGYGTTSAMQKTLADNVRQMFNDKQIIAYLSN